MAYQPINMGSGPDTKTGDKLYVAGPKINANFVELYNFKNSATAIGLGVLTAATQAIARGAIGAGIVQTVSGGSTGLTITGTTSLALGGTLNLANGGTGAVDQAGARLNFGLPLLVTNGYSPSTFVTAIASASDLVFARAATVTLTSTAHRLTQAVNGYADLRRGKIVYDYSDTSNSVNFNVSDLRNGTVEIATTRNIQRLLRFQNPNGRLEDIKLRSVDYINNSNDQNDALVRVEVGADDAVFRNVIMENVGIGILPFAKNLYIENMLCRGMIKAIAMQSCDGITIDGFRWYGASPLAVQDPGHNAIGGTGRRVKIVNFYIGPSEDGTTLPNSTGEHGIYLSGLDNTVNGFIHIAHGEIWRPGQCGIKLKDYHTIHIEDVQCFYVPGVTTPSDNEEAYRFERIIGLTGGALHSGSEPVTGTGRGGYHHMHFTGCGGVRLLETSYAENCFAGGIKFDVDDTAPTLPHLDHIIRVRHKNVGGPSVILADNIIVNDEILIYLDTDGCPGSPVSIGTGITWGPNGKIRVIGTYRNCGAAPPVSTANVDLSQFVLDASPADYGYGQINPGRIHRRAIKHHLPFKFPDYATIISTYGYNYLYPQGSSVDGGDLFVLYLSNGGSSGIGWNWVAVYDWTTGAYKYCFSCGSVVGEGGGGISSSGGVRYYLGRDTATSVSYFDITSVTNRSRLTAARTEEVERTLQVSTFGDLALTSDRNSYLATVIRRNRYKLWDTTTTPWTLKSRVVFPFNEVGQYGDSTETSTTARPLPKTQGVAFGAGWYAHGMGGYFAKGGTVYPYNLWGVRLFSDGSTKIADGLCNPSAAITLIEAAGITCTRLESEGAFLAGGTLYTINVTQTHSDAGAATGGVVIFAEMSDAPDALDFFDCRQSHVKPDRAAIALQFPNGNGKLYDPYTGSEIATMEQMCDFLLASDLSQTSWYSSTIPAFTGIDGTTYAAAQKITVLNPNNSTYEVIVEQLSGSLVRRYRITGSPGSRAQTALAQTRVMTAGGTLNAYDLIAVVNKVTGSATAIGLPASPVTDQRHTIKDGKGDAATNNITITPAAGTIDGAANLVINTNYGVARLIYNGTQWNVI